MERRKPSGSPSLPFAACWSAYCRSLKCSACTSAEAAKTNNTRLPNLRQPSDMLTGSKPYSAILLPSSRSGPAHITKHAHGSKAAFPFMIRKPLSNPLVRPRQIPQIPIYQPPSHLRLTDMDQVTLHRVIQIATIHHLSVQQCPFTPSHLPAPLLIHKQPTPQSLRLDIQEAS